MRDPLASIDRLATGELDEPARRELFAWLDAEPAHWRRCALALLETRELEEAFAERATGAAPSMTTTPPSLTMTRFRWQSLAALAASVLIAFSLGAWARGLRHVPDPMIAQSPEPRKSPHMQRGEQAPVRRAATQASDSPEPDAPEKTVAKAEAPAQIIPPYIRSQWERRGYQVTSQQVELPVVLPDGQRVMVPANELQVNYVGQRTY